jgi:hypothetical protein
MLKIIFYKLENFSSHFTLKNFLLVLICFLLSSLSYASEPSFTVPKDEQTYIYLRKLFGSIPGVLSCEDASCSILVPTIFKTLNQGVMTIGIAILSYVFYMGTAVSASEGEFLGKRYSSFWLPLRSAVGIGILVPGTSGYSFLQIALMKIILSGVGLANYMYKVVDDYGSKFSISLDTKVDDSGNVSTPQVFNPNDVDLFVKNAFLYFVAAMKVSRKQDFTMYVAEKNGGKDEVLSVTQDLSEKKLVFKIVTKIDEDAGNETSSINMSYQGPINPSQMTFLFGSTPASILAGDGLLGQIYIQALIYCQTYPGKQLGSIPGIELSSIADRLYQSSIDIISPSAKKQEENQTQKLSKEYSWLKVPSRYYTWVETNKESQKNQKPTITFTFNNDYLQNYNTIDVKVNADESPIIRELAQNIAKIPLLKNVGGSSTQSSQLKDYYPMYDTLKNEESGGANSLLLSMMLDPLNSDKGDLNDPIIILAEKGRGMITTYMVVLLSMIGVSLGIVALSAICSAVKPSWVGTSFSFIQILMTIAQFFALVLPVAIMLGFYLPLIPLMIFNLAVIAWFMQVIEAMVAAPIITLGLLAPSQEGVGKAAPSLMLVLNIVLRPTLIIVGLVMGAKLFSIFALYFSEIMSSGALLFSEGSGFVFLIFGWIWVMMYSSAIVTVAQKCFSLIYVIPDRVLTWIGGQSLDSRDISQDLQEMKGAAAKSEEIVKGVGQSAGQGFAAIGRYMKGKADKGE